MMKLPCARSPRLPAAVLLAAGAAVALAGNVAAETISFSKDQPTLDRWNYPFNQTPGFRTEASIFGAFVDNEPDGFHPDFDNRDAQFHVGFDTDQHVEPGLGAASYHVIEARITLMVANHLQFRYDPTFNIWQSYLPEDHPDYIPDDAPGRPIELFGVGFRHGYDPLTYEEDTPYSPYGPFGKGHRTTYALDYDEAGEPRDVSNNMDEMFDPYPFSIGLTDAVEPGDLVPADTVFTFDLDVEDPYVQAYLQEQLDLGIVHFMAASLFHASEDDFDGSFPSFYTKENPLVLAGVADAAGLEMVVDIIDTVPGDLTGDGSVGVPDLLILIGSWGACSDCDECPADLNGDCAVGVNDLLILISNWG